MITDTTQTPIAAAVTVREATPEDKDFLAWATLTASRSHVNRGIWEAFLGWNEDRTLDFIGRVLMSEREHWVHWTQFLVAEVGGEPAAALCAYDPETHGFEPYYEVSIELGQQLMTATEFEGAGARGEVIMTCMSDEPAGSWIIENVATAEAFRRRGLCDLLLAEAFDRGRARGHKLTQISVYLGNDPARAAYLKHGYLPVDEKRSLEFEALMGFAGIERLQRPL